MATARTRRAAPKPEPVEIKDPNSESTNRTFEVLTYLGTTSEGHVTIIRRIRFARGAPEDNVFALAGERAAYFGLISYPKGSRWTHYGWGHILVSDFTELREVFPELEKKAQGEESK